MQRRLPPHKTAGSVPAVLLCVNSENMTAEDLNRHYNLRDASEKQYALVKTQIGDHVSRTHFDRGLYSKMAAGFIASIIRHQLMQAAQKLDINTNSLVRELNLLEIHHLSGDTYVYSRTASEKQRNILQAFDLSERTLELIALRENTQDRSPERNPINQLPESQQEKPKRGRPKGVKNKVKSGNTSINAEPILKRGSGRPKGSKNKKTLLREAEEARLCNSDHLTKRGKGRPKGSKNKSTLEREAREAELREKGLLPEKRKPGRPKGAKNKAKKVQE